MFVLVDFFNVGPAIEAVDSLNGVQSVSGRMVVSTAQLGKTSGAVRDAAGGWVGAALVGMGVVALGNFVWL